MKKWTKDIEIDAPIEQVWKFFDGSLNDIQKIMPNVVEHRPVKITNEQVGSVYRQTYKQGERIDEYDIETLEYVNENNKKRKKIGYIFADMVEVTACYELNKINDNKTLFEYTIINRPLNWQLKLFSLFAKKKPVVEFVERVKNTAEFEAETEVSR
ncbi:SRPBCC family protein [Metabacillus fastidiosus]|uniref:SRPBCC family protein n=1 Tax=Metabacillus fastidiosus TaxID=1458 RepID=UPI002E245422|nr:SRPBCC family protein [Metabacillus fastidiosus]